MFVETLQQCGLFQGQVQLLPPSSISRELISIPQSLPVNKPEHTSKQKAVLHSSSDAFFSICALVYFLQNDWVLEGNGCHLSTDLQVSNSSVSQVVKAGWRHLRRPSAPRSTASEQAGT